MPRRIYRWMSHISYATLLSKKKLGDSQTTRLVKWTWGTNSATPRRTTSMANHRGSQAIHYFLFCSIFIFVFAFNYFIVNSLEIHNSSNQHKSYCLQPASYTRGFDLSLISIKTFLFLFFLWKSVSSSRRSAAN